MREMEAAMSLSYGIDFGGHVLSREVHPVLAVSGLDALVSGFDVVL